MQVKCLASSALAGNSVFRSGVCFARDGRRSVFLNFPSGLVRTSEWSSCPQELVSGLIPSFGQQVVLKSGGCSSA